MDSNRKAPTIYSTCNLHANHLFLRTIMYQVKSKSPYLKNFSSFSLFFKCLPPVEESFSRMESSCWPFSWLGGYGTMARNTWEERSRKFCLHTNTYTRVEPWGWKVCTNHLFLHLIERNKIIIIYYCESIVFPSSSYPSMVHVEQESVSYTMLAIPHGDQVSRERRLTCQLTWHWLWKMCK